MNNSNELERTGLDPSEGENRLQLSDASRAIDVYRKVGGEKDWSEQISADVHWASLPEAAERLDDNSPRQVTRGDILKSGAALLVGLVVVVFLILELRPPPQKTVDAGVFGVLTEPEKLAPELQPQARRFVEARRSKQHPEALKALQDIFANTPTNKPLVQEPLFTDAFAFLAERRSTGDWTQEHRDLFTCLDSYQHSNILDPGKAARLYLGVVDEILPIIDWKAGGAEPANMPDRLRIASWKKQVDDLRGTEGVMKHPLLKKEYLEDIERRYRWSQAAVFLVWLWGGNSVEAGEWDPDLDFKLDSAENRSWWLAIDHTLLTLHPPDSAKDGPEWTSVRKAFWTTLNDHYFDVPFLDDAVTIEALVYNEKAIQAGIKNPTKQKDRGGVTQ